MQSFHTGPGRKAYELRDKRILEWLNKGDKTLSEIDDTIKKEFGTSSKTTITKLKKNLNMRRNTKLQNKESAKKKSRLRKIAELFKKRDG